MQKAKFLFSLPLICLLVFPLIIYAADETLTITTHYPPSPYGSYNNLTAANSLGVGTTSPTVIFEVACPAGFTNVKAGNHQLGCMETADHGDRHLVYRGQYVLHNLRRAASKLC